MGTGAASPNSRSAPLTGSTTGGAGSGAAVLAATSLVAACEETAFKRATIQCRFFGTGRA